jgi:hypothetical protein
MRGSPLSSKVTFPTSPKGSPSLSLGTSLRGSRPSLQHKSTPFPGEKRYPAGISTSTNVRLTEAEIRAVSMACRTAMWVPTDNNSVPTDSGAFRASASRTRGPPRARARWVNSSTDQYALRGERGSRSFAARAECRGVTARAGCARSVMWVCAAFSNATLPTIRTALTISRPQNCERNAPESVGTLSLPVGTHSGTASR